MVTRKTVGWVLAVGFIGISPVWGAELCGRFLVVKGDVKVVREGRAQPVRLNDPVYVGDRIVTGEGLAKILLQDNSLLTLDRNSELEVSQFLFQAQKKRRGLFSILKGKVKALMGKFFRMESFLQFETPTAIAGVRGTYFRADVEPDQSTFTVFEGEVEVKDRAGNIVPLRAGEQLRVGPQGWVAPPRKLDPQELRSLEQEGEGEFRAVVLEHTASREENLNRVREVLRQVRREAGGPAAEGEVRREAPRTEATPTPGVVQPIPPVNLQSVDPALTRNVRVRIVFPEIP